MPYTDNELTNADITALNRIAARKESSEKTCPIAQRLELFFQALSLAERKYPTRSPEAQHAAATAVLLTAA